MKKFLVGILILFSIGCQPTPQPEKPSHIFAEFFVRYLQTESQLKAQATFLQGDTLETATPKVFNNGVSFQGTTMENRKLPGELIRYSLLQQTVYKDTFHFRFEGLDGDLKELVIGMSPVNDFFLKGPFSKSQGANIVINGGLLNEYESLVLLFSNAENKASTITLDGPTKKIEYFLSPEQLAKLSLGKGQLYLVKKQSNRYQTSSISANYGIEYYTNILDIEVVE